MLRRLADVMECLVDPKSRAGADNTQQDLATAKQRRAEDEGICVKLGK
jgi:hypothetical protein